MFLGVAGVIVGAGGFGLRRGAAAQVVGTAEAGLDALLNAGGRVLVLEHSAYPAGVFPETPGKATATMTFGLAPGHPVLRGISPDDLKFWRGDHLVTAGQFARPARGGSRALIVSGTQEGLSQTPLLEFPRGRGAAILSQMLLTAKLESEPAAARLLQNCLDYLAGYRPHTGGTAVVASDPAFPATLRSLGVRFEDLSGQLAGADLSRFRLLIAQGSVEPLLAAKDAVDAFVAAGGTVLLHRPPAEEFAKLKALHASTQVPQAYDGPVQPASADDPVSRALTREDLYWLGKHVGLSWSATPLAAGVADFAFAPALDEKSAVATPSEKMTAAGAYAGANEKEAFLASGGTITAEMEVPKAGAYVLGLVARGTPAAGVFPQASVAVEAEGAGKPVSHRLGVIGVAGREWKTYTVSGDLPAGRQRVRVTFLNDAQIGGEDRNFYLQRLLVAPAGGADTAVPLTSPAALVRIPRGKGSYVVDAIRWDTEQDNGTRAAHFALSLLGALGAEFDALNGIPLEAESMEPDPKMPWFRATATSALLAAAGYVQAAVEIPSAGPYRLEVVARGTPCKGIYPVVEVLLDEQSLGKVELAGGNWRAYPLDVTLPKGKHTLRLAFINDASEAPEDRNLFLDKVIFYRGR